MLSGTFPFGLGIDFALLLGYSWGMICKTIEAQRVKDRKECEQL